MTCSRCNSMMFRERYDDPYDTHGQGFDALHCLLCGNIVDPVIMRHQQHRVEPRTRQARLASVVST